MIVVTTPMCKQIVEWAGLKEFKVNKHPDKEKGDLAILLSESKVDMNSIRLKLNTFSQIKESILNVSSYCYNHNLTDKLINEEDISEIFSSYDLEFLDELVFNQIKNENSNKRVKVYSEFLKDIVLDIGATLNEKNYSFVVYPDYLIDKVCESENLNDSSIVFIEIPSHTKVSKDPIERTKERYSIVLNALNE